MGFIFQPKKYPHFIKSAKGEDSSMYAPKLNGEKIPGGKCKYLEGILRFYMKFQGNFIL